MALSSTGCSRSGAIRRFHFLCLAVMLLCLWPGTMLGEQENDGNITAPKNPRLPRPGRFIVEVVHTSDGSPVAGIRVDLLQTSQTFFTGANGRVEFFLSAGEYDARVYGLSGPGPALRTQEVHASVRPGLPVVVRVYDCDDCM